MFIVAWVRAMAFAVALQIVFEAFAAPLFARFVTAAFEKSLSRPHRRFARSLPKADLLARWHIFGRDETLLAWRELI